MFYERRVWAFITLTISCQYLWQRALILQENGKSKKLSDDNANVPWRKTSGCHIWGVWDRRRDDCCRWWKAESTWQYREQTPPPPTEHRHSAHYSQKASLGWRMEWHNLANGEEKMTSEFKWPIHCTQEGHTFSGNQGRKYGENIRKGVVWCSMLHIQSYINKYFEDLLATSGGTLSMVASRLPKMTGSLAIFSGLLIQFWHTHYRLNIVLLK